MLKPKLYLLQIKLEDNKTHITWFAAAKLIFAIFTIILLSISIFRSESRELTKAFEGLASLESIL